MHASAASCATVGCEWRVSSAAAARSDRRSDRRSRSRAGATAASHGRPRACRGRSSRARAPACRASRPGRSVGASPSARARVREQARRAAHARSAGTAASRSPRPSRSPSPGGGRRGPRRHARCTRARPPRRGPRVRRSRRSGPRSRRAAVTRSPAAARRGCAARIAKWIRLSRSASLPGAFTEPLPRPVRVVERLLEAVGQHDDLVVLAQLAPHALGVGVRGRSRRDLRDEVLLREAAKSSPPLASRSRIATGTAPFSASSRVSW